MEVSPEEKRENFIKIARFFRGQGRDIPSLFVAELEKFPYDKEIDALLHPEKVREKKSSDFFSGEDQRIKSFLQVMIPQLDYPEIVSLCMTSRAARDFCLHEDFRKQIVEKRIEMVDRMKSFSLQDWDLYCQVHSNKRLAACDSLNIVKDMSEATYESVRQAKYEFDTKGKVSIFIMISGQRHVVVLSQMRGPQGNDYYSVNSTKEVIALLEKWAEEHNIESRTQNNTQFLVLRNTKSGEIFANEFFYSLPVKTISAL